MNELTTVQDAISNSDNPHDYLKSLSDALNNLPHINTLYNGLCSYVDSKLGKLTPDVSIMHTEIMHYAFLTFQDNDEKNLDYPIGVSDSDLFQREQFRNEVNQIFDNSIIVDDVTIRPTDVSEYGKKRIMLATHWYNTASMLIEKFT